MCCGVGRRCSSDLMLLQLWRRPAAVALIGSLAWELPYATGVALKSKKQNKTNFTKGSLRTSGPSGSWEPCLLLGTCAWQWCVLSLGQGFTTPPTLPTAR